MTCSREPESRPLVRGQGSLANRGIYAPSLREMSFATGKVRASSSLELLRVAAESARAALDRAAE
jgi:hypothetical protein